MTKPPLFTAAIICFNRPEMVRVAIESVLAQTFDDFELVIVDDASTDGSPEVIRGYSDRARVVLREQNGGEMAARNSVMEVARGDYIAFLDSDDVWFPWTLATFAEAIRRNGRPTMVGGHAFGFTDEAVIRDVKQDEYADSHVGCYLASNYYLGTNSVVVARQAIVDVGGFTPLRLNGIDSDLMFRIGDRAGFAKVDSPYTFAYRQHDSIIRNIELSYGGARYLIDTELAGKYPGGAALRPDRLRHVTRRTRNITLQFIRQGENSKALDLYRRTFWWNLEQRRWSYLGSTLAMLLCPPLGWLYSRRMKARHGY